LRRSRSIRAQMSVPRATSSRCRCRMVAVMSSEPGGDTEKLPGGDTPPLWRGHVIPGESCHHNGRYMSPSRGDTPPLGGTHITYGLHWGPGHEMTPNIFSATPPTKAQSPSSTGQL
jgi:hypothetical protein